MLPDMDILILSNIYLLPLLDVKEPKDCIRRTPIHFAAKYGHNEVVMFMILYPK